MGLTNNLGKLSNMITSTGSAVGIAQASPAYTLDVSGTGRFTGALTAASYAVSNTAGAIFAASGTTSAIYGYINNTSGRFYFGSESSTGGSITTGSTAYYGQIAAQGLQFSANTGSNVHMTLTPSGNVGIGTSSPVALDTGGVNLQIKDRSALFQLAAVNSTYLSNNIYYDGSWKRIVSGYGALIRLNDDNNGFSFLTTGTGGANSAVTFTSAMAITNAGGVFINQTTGAGQLTVAGDTSGSFYPVEINQLQSGSASATTVRFLRQGGLVGTITTTNANTAYNTSSSDLRLKKNIENWDEIAIDLFKNINPKLFHFNNQEDSDEKTKGFIAQEMVDKFPEAYPLNGEGYYSFNPSGMVVYLVKAIQEQQTTITSLQDRLDKAGL